MFIPDETAVQTLATISDVQLINGRFNRVQFSDDGTCLLCLGTKCWCCHFVSHVRQFQTGGT